VKGKNQMSTLYIPNSIALRNFDSLFKNNDFNFSDKKADITFHRTYVAMHPVGLAFYAALSDLFIENGIETTATINYDIRSIPYLQRMGLFRTFGYSDPLETKEHEETGRFIPLMKIRNSDELDTFIKTIDPILHTSRENSRVIKHVFSELLRNVLEHSYAKRGGNVCATYNRKRNKISIGISDAGIGLLNSMKHHHSLSNHEEALSSALTPGISGKSSRIGGTPENAGAGLFFTKCIAQSTRNHFLIYSGDSYFKLNLTRPNENIEFNPNPCDDHRTSRTDLPYFQGTLVGIDINITETEAFNNLIQKIGNAYQLSVKKSKKDFFRRINFT
jgi:anti-sigma regulatory factor (Ser/Thr protein kinase)